MTTLQALIAFLTALSALPWLPRAGRWIADVVTQRGRERITREDRERADRAAEVQRHIDRAERAEDRRERDRDACEAEKRELRAALNDAEGREMTLAIEAQRLTAALSRSIADRDQALAEAALAERFVDGMLGREK